MGAAGGGGWEPLEEDGVTRALGTPGALGYVRVLRGLWQCQGLCKEAAVARWRIGVKEQPEKHENGLVFILFYSLCLGKHCSPVEGVFW